MRGNERVRVEVSRRTRKIMRGGFSILAAALRGSSLGAGFSENDAKLGDDRDGRSGENFGGIRESKFFNRFNHYLSLFATIGKLIKISGSAANLREFLI